jgi:hypothetical protein
MTEPDNSLNDSLDAMLVASIRPEANDGLRGAVLMQTIGVLRRRRRLKRCALAASLLCCYLAGVTTVEIWRPGDGNAVRAVTEATAAKPRPRNVVPQKSPKPTKPEIGQVATAPLSGFESWRRIGDHYLRDSDDFSLAIAGYSWALDLASDKDLAISPGKDNWLLMALKDARAKERKHAYSEQN